MYSTYITVCKLSFALSIQCLLFCSLLICFVMKYDICNYLDIFFSFSDEVISLTPKNKFKIIVGSKPEKYKNIKAQGKLRCLYKRCEIPGSSFVQDECSICLSELRHPSETYGATSKNSVVELKQCHHKFHECCIVQCYENGNKVSMSASTKNFPQLCILSFLHYLGLISRQSLKIAESLQWIQY